MSDPRPLSRDISDHEVRSAFARVKQDATIVTSLFTGYPDAAPSRRLSGARVGEEMEILARIKEVQEEIERYRATLQERKQSIAEGLRR